MSRWYTVVVLTASVSSYAELIVAKLDPMNKCVRRCFDRSYCTLTNGQLTKDLLQFKVSLSSVVLLDNDPSCIHGSTQAANVLHAPSFTPRGATTTAASEDTFLIDVALPVLDALRHVQDVRNVLGRGPLSARSP